MKFIFEPYRDLKDNLQKDLTAKLSTTDTVIKQTITQIFRSKVQFYNMTFCRLIFNFIDFKKLVKILCFLMKN